MADFISLDEHLRFWAPERPVSNLPAKLGSSPSLACSSRSPRGQSMTQALSSMPPIQGGSLTKQVSDDASVISSEKKAKDSHDCGTYTGDKDMANTNLFHSDIGKLCPDNDYSLFKREIIMSIGDKKSNETAVPVGIFSGSSEITEASDGLYSSGASRLIQLGGADAEFSDGEESMSLCTDVSGQSMGSVSDPPYQQDGSALTQVSCDEIHYCTTPCSVPPTTSRSSHLSLDCDSNDQPAPLTRKSTPEPSSNYPNLSQGGLDRIGEQPKSNRIDLDPLLSSPKADQVLNNGVSITTDIFSSTATISSHLSSDSGCSDQPATLIRKSTPEPSSSYPNLSQDGLDKVGEQPKNGRTNLDPQLSSLEVDQILKNGVSSHICISGEDSQKLPQSKTSTGIRYELRDRSLKNRKKRPIAEEEIDNDENESLPLTKRAKGRWRPREPRSRVTGEPRINRSNATSTGMEGLASAAVNNEKQWSLSDVFLRSIKDNERENLILFFTRTSSRDEDSTISEILRGVASINKGGPQTDMLLLSNAVLKLTRINGATGLTFSFQVEAGGNRCRAHAGQDLTPVEAPPECYQEDTDQGLTPVEMLLAKVFDVKKQEFKYLAKWKGWHNRSNEWRWESELRPEDVERYNRDHLQNFYGKIVKKHEEKGVLKYRMKWKFIPHDYSWLRKDEIVEKLITEYEEKEGKKR